MKRTIAQSTNYVIEYDKGKFDDWCIYLTENGNSRYAPRDPEYFTFLQKLGAKYGSATVYNDYIQVFNATTKDLSINVMQLIKQLAVKYGADGIEYEKWLIVIYAGMIAEENKAFTKLGKRVKHLGIYQVLMQNIAPDVAANYSKGKGWRLLDAEMKQYGF